MPSVFHDIKCNNPALNFYFLLYDIEYSVLVENRAKVDGTRDIRNGIASQVLPSICVEIEIPHKIVYRRPNEIIGVIKMKSLLK